MNKPSLYERIHWRVFNFLVKAFGYGLIFVSIVFVLLIVAAMIGKPLRADYPTWYLMIFVPLVLLGTLIIKAEPYYPKKYQQWFRGNTKERA